MNKKSTTKFELKSDKLPSANQNLMKKLDKITDDEIDYSDILETDESFWENKKLIDIGNKQMISIRVDQDILQWYKLQGGRYQVLINEVLRCYMNAHRKKSRKIKSS